MQKIDLCIRSSDCRFQPSSTYIQLVKLVLRSCPLVLELPATRVARYFRMRGAIHRHNSFDVFRFQGKFILVYFRLQVRLFRLHLAELCPQRLSTLFGTRETPKSATQCGQP